MRRWALPITKEPGTYLLAVAVFTLGFWGVWATLLQGGLVTPLVYQIAVDLGFVAPLAFIPLIRKWRPYQSSSGSLIVWITIVAAYVMVADLVVRGLGYVMGQLFPHILGLAPLTPMALQIGYPDVRAAITVAAFGIMLLVALVDSIVTVAQSFRKPDLPADADVPQVIREANRRAEGPGVFVVDVTKEFINKFRGFARLINLVVPVVVFTSLSVLIILMLDVFREYNTYGAFAEPTAIWGMAILTMTLALVGFTTAVFFAPWPEPDSPTAQDGTDCGAAETPSGSWERRSPRTRNWPSIVKASGILLFGSYVFASVAGSVLLAVWLALWASGRSALVFTPGPIYLINLVFAALVVGTLLVLGVAVDWTRQRLVTPNPPGSGRVISAARYVLPMALVLLGITAMVFGVRPMVQAFSFVLRSHDASAAEQLQAVVPTEIAGSCTEDHLVLANSKADLTCTLGSDRGIVSYHLFAQNDEMNNVYASILNGRGLDSATGTCPATDTSSGTYAHGQVGCYTYGGTAWTVWTDDRSGVLSLAFRSDGNLTELYDYWRMGALGPATPVQP